MARVEEILFWKKIYAAKGVEKHADDLIAIETGIRPFRINNAQDDPDDLPF